MLEAKRIRRTFTTDFKQETVKLVLEQTYKISEVANNLDIGVSG